MEVHPPREFLSSIPDTLPPLPPVSDGIMTLNELPDGDHTTHLGDQASERSDQTCNQNHG